MKKNPYIGPRPYERGDRYEFYGRDREARDLLALVLAERTVLFYAPSGAGKSSLLNAQIIPALEQEGFQVLPVTRVGNDIPPTVDPGDVDNVFVFSALMGLTGDEVPVEQLVGHTLRSFLQRYSPDEADEKDEGGEWDDLAYRPPILVLDQFEEILTTHRDRWREARGFFEQVRQVLQDVPTLGIVFAMREDHVAGLDPYTPLLPRRLRARFRMERLDRDGALEAVRKPAQNAGCPFDPGVAEQLVDDLRRIKIAAGGPGYADRAESAPPATVLGPFVEPVQLQVVCSRLWENLPEQEDNAIQWAEVEKFGDIDRALIDFYEDGLARCVRQLTGLDPSGAPPGVSERQLRQWFGEQLITPMETRGLVLRGAQETGGLPNEAIDILEKQHLIRAEARAGARWYELSHDRMVDPILQSNRAWEMAQQSPLRLAARRWKESGQDRGILYRGRTLKEAQAWAEANPADVTPYEREFLEASQRDERHRVRVRRLRAFGTVAAVLIILLIGTLAILTYRAGRIAMSKEWASNAMRYRNVNQEQSIIMAQIAVEASDTVEAQIALRQAIIDYYPAKVLMSDNTEHVVNVAYSPDGKSLAVSRANGRVKLWDPRSQRPLQTLQIPGAETNWVWGLAYSPDGQRLATGGNVPIRIWNITSGETVATLEGHTGLVYSLAYSPDGRFLASGGSDGTVCLWNLSTGNSVISLTKHTGIPHLAYSPDGQRLAIGSGDGTIRLWEFSPSRRGDLQATVAMTLTGHTAPVNRVAFNPAGDLLASASDDKTIRLWDLEAPAAGSRGKAILTLVGHSDIVIDLAFSSDGRYLISGSRDATVRLWDVTARKNEAIAILTGHRSIVNGVTFDPRGRYLSSGSADGTVRVWDTEPPAGAMLTNLIGHTGTVYGLDYSPDGRHLASGSSDGTVRLWSAATGKTEKMMSIDSTVWNVTYSPDGRYLLTCSADDLARVWDVSVGPTATLATLAMTLVGHTADVNAAAYSSNGQFIATASDDKTARIWDAATGQLVSTLKGHTKPIYALDYAPDGLSIATGSVDTDVRIWDVETGELVAVLSGHTDPVFDVAFSPDGETLASASWDNTARIWSLETYTTTAILDKHASYVYSLAYSPDGEQLATSSWDQTVRLWRLTGATPEPIAILIGATSLVRSVAYSPDGKYVAAGSRSGEIHRYPARFEDAEALSWEYVPRELTEEEQEHLDRLEVDPFDWIGFSQ